jgi:uncharacterized membrane protein YgdD (TMEM256/DUF423 family)
MGLTRFAAAAIAFAALAGLAAVALGAWSAHGLAPQAASWVETAARYAMWHALAIVGAALMAERVAGAARRLAMIAAIAFGIGIALFSGSLVALAAGGWGRAAPFGGVAFMVGWALLAAAALAALRGRAASGQAP